MAMKRPAASSAGAMTKKTKAKDPKVLEIEEMVKAAEAFPESVRNMLCVVMEHSLLVPKDKRHKMQEEAVDMVEQMLTSVQAGLQAKCQDLQAKLAEGDVQKNAREGAATAAADVVEQKAEAVQVAKQALAGAVGDSAQAKSSRKEALAEQDAANKQFASAGAKKAELENALNTDFENIKAGDSKAVKGLLKVAKAFGVEEQLLKAAESALIKAPADRGGFDTIVFEQVEQKFKDLIAAFGGTITNFEANSKALADKVAAAEAASLAAEELVETRRSELTAAEAAFAEAETLKKQAAKALKDFGPEMRSLNVALQDAHNELKGGETVIGAFRELATRTAVSQVVEAEGAKEVEAKGDAEAEGEAEVAADDCVEAAE